jgi:serine/threonine protein kinase
MTRAPSSQLPDADVHAGSCVALRYELETLVGRGRTSLVYKARDLIQDRRVAVKLLFGEAPSDADLETGLRGSSIAHPGIVQTLHVGLTDDGIPFVVTELLEGHSIARLLETLTIPRSEALRIVLRTTEAVAAAHAHEIVHGDLDASNVFLTLDGDVKVRNFGSRTGGALADHPVSSPHTVEPVPRDDVCALGSLLLQMIAPAASGPTESWTDRPTEALVPAGLDPWAQVMVLALSAAAGRLDTAADFASHLRKAAALLEEKPWTASSNAASPAPVPSLVGRVLGGRYQLESVIGRGATSVVCKALHLELGSWVAVKLLSPASTEMVDAAIIDRFRFEAQALAGLHHPNIPTVLDCGTTEEGSPYIVMEFLEGETLARLLGGRRRLPPDLVVSFACEAAEALAVLHDWGFVHRDVKLGNIFVARDPVKGSAIKLIDFGLARALDLTPFSREVSGTTFFVEGPRRRLLTQQGLILGTAAYMSPELIQNADLDARSDIYALGIVVYRMLTGTTPFHGKDMPQLLSRHLFEPPEPLRQRAPDADIPEALERAVLCALEKSPANRPASARAFASQLRAAIGAGDDGRPPLLPAPDAKALVLVHGQTECLDLAPHEALSEAACEAASAGVVAPADVAFTGESRRRVAQWAVVFLLALCAPLSLYAFLRSPTAGALWARTVHGPAAAPQAERPTSDKTVLATSAPTAQEQNPTFDSGSWDLAIGRAVIDPVRRPRGTAVSKASTWRGPPEGLTLHPRVDDFKTPTWRSSEKAER